jgi:arsenite-transporting ATPase
VPLAHGTLFAAEIDAVALARKWLSSRMEALREIALRGTWLDEEDVGELLGLSLPGIDEAAGLLDLLRIGRSRRYDVIVVDTAPTGHTLRMLGMPEVLARVAGVFDAMQEKHRAVVGALRGAWTPDAADAFLAGVMDDAAEFGALLRDPARTAVTWVSLAEDMAVAETLDALRALADEKIPVSDVVFNRLATGNRAGCRFCAARRRVERAAISALVGRVGEAIAVRGLPECEHEPRGLRALARVARGLTEDRKKSAAPTAVRYTLDPKASIPDSVQGRMALPKADWRFGFPPTIGDASVVLFGGKGGVGKTTCAAAAALSIAARFPTRHVVLLSTDPAHSLGDVLGAHVTDTAAPIPWAPPNLSVRELDAARAFRRARDEYADAIESLFDRIGGERFDAVHDRRVMHALLDLAPPGLDELVAIVEVTALVAGPDAHRGGVRLIVDTAPSGHALRLLETPAILQDWTRALMRIVLKYQPVTGAGRLGELLLTLSRRIGALRQLLEDPLRCRFVVVTRPAALPRLETERLLPALGRLRIDVPAIIVNAAGRGTCRPCRLASAAETRETRAILRLASAHSPHLVVVVTPAEMPPPRTARLAAWLAAGAARMGNGKW